MYISKNEYQLPTIIMVDPDKDGFDVFNYAKSKSNSYIEIQTNSSIKVAHVFHNLYLISLPQNSSINQQQINSIEDMFDKTLQQQKIGNKTLCLDNKCSGQKHNNH